MEKIKKDLEKLCSDFMKQLEEHFEPEGMSIKFNSITFTVEQKQFKNALSAMTLKSKCRKNAQGQIVCS